MVLDAQGNYSRPDVATRHVHVITKDHIGPMSRQPKTFSAKFQAGEVIKVTLLGATQVPGAPIYHIGGGAWIEHATADVGDILPMADVTAAIAIAQERQAAVAAYRKAEAAKPNPAPVAPLSAAELAELRAMLAAKATPAAPAHSPVENPAPVG